MSIFRYMKSQKLLVLCKAAPVGLLCLLLLACDGQKADEHFKRAEAHYQVGSYDLALEELNTAIAIKPHNSYYFFRGITHFKAGDYDSAFSDFETACDHGSDKGDMRACSMSVSMRTGVDIESLIRTSIPQR